MSQPNPVQTFLLEAEDLLTQIEEVALEVDTSAPDSEAINRLFRAFHTIKGSGAMFGFEAVARFTHHVETALDLVREGKLDLSKPLLDLVLASKDRIKDLLEAGQGSEDLPPGASQKLIDALQTLCHGGPQPTPTPKATAAPSSAPASSTQTFRIQFQPDPGLMVSGTNPVALLQELRGLGDCTIQAITQLVPNLDSIQPDKVYLGWDIELTTTQSRNAIQDVFIFVEDGSKIDISQIQAKAGTTKATGEIRTTAPAPQPAATINPTAPSAPAATAQPAKGETPPPNSKKAGSKDATVRVPSDKLDSLVNLVGELVMNQSRLCAVASRLDSSELSVPVEEIERLVSELRDNVLGIRMTAIGSTFSRFKRLVHDLSAELGKEIDLVTEGAETELDKTVLDQLGDPLIHLIRNSLDHGIETADRRVAAGKSRRGTIRLSAAHTGSNVVVTIEDDGKGLDTAAIRAKAIEKQLIPADAVLSDKEIFNLIFLPGFSTAKQITSVSGRGVGMDVVKRQIEGLRGTVSLHSELGRGTTTSLTLPLTLAIIDGLLVEIAGDQFIIPMSVVTENVELHRSQRTRNNGRNVIAVRGELIPYMRLRELFHIDEQELDLEKIVIARHDDQRIGLVVDRVLGSHQTVIQSLGRFYKQVNSFSGATIMGDGRVALILDLAGLIQQSESQGTNLTLGGSNDFAPRKDLLNSPSLHL